ncbi:hypothetical protein ACFWX5_14405 [[Kitasatospora] papulosa]|uniref:hypothetical protein n=1 Tax=[Kitasatospora] papulosa TaxID=1464011 RepID=UPI0036A2631C
MLATAWSVADQLGLTARTAGDLVAALAGDRRRTVIVLSDVHGESVAELVLDMVKHQHLRLVVESRSGSPAHRMLSQAGCAELNLDLEQWRDQQRFEQWQASQPKEPGPPPISCEATIDLSDPVAVCEADPWLVTDAYSAEQTQGHGGLRDAWLRAGQALCQEQAPASRALTLLAALSDGADPRLAPALAALAGKTQWQVSWSRVRGDLVPPWPGPVTALAQGRGPVANVLLAAGREGVVRLVREADGSAHGRLSLAGMQPQSMTVMADGTVLVLDEYGRVHAESGLVGRPSGSGIEALLDDGPTSAEVLIAALRGLNSTALAYAPGTAGGVQLRWVTAWAWCGPSVSSRTQRRCTWAPWRRWQPSASCWVTKGWCSFTAVGWTARCGYGRRVARPWTSRWFSVGVLWCRWTYARHRMDC